MSKYEQRTYYQAGLACSNPREYARMTRSYNDIRMEYEILNSTDLRYTSKQVRAFAKANNFKIKWYEYVFTGLLRKRLLKYLRGV